MSNVDKKVLRDTYLQKRKTLVKNELNSRNASIRLFFEQIAIASGQNVHVFLPIEKNAEVSTYDLIAYLKSRNINVIISRSSLDENTMEHFLYVGDDQLSINKWGIPEPTDGKSVEPSAIDLVLIPLIVFDRLGHRIGYGKGYYDRFLRECRPDVRKIGLSLSPPLDKIEFTDAHDIKMDQCVTHLGVYSF